LSWTEVILPLILAIIAAAPGIIALFRGRQKEKADVAKAITEAAGELVEEYKDRLARIEGTIAKQADRIRCQELKIERQAEKIAEQAERIMALELERDEFLNGVLSLCAQIRALGHNPVWEPEPPDDK
jgi:hypothetical protein